MKKQRALTAVTLVNLALMLFLFVRQTTSVQASSALPVLRAQALEIVDAKGRLRASLQVIPEGPSRRPDGSPAESSGKIYPEAVVFRLIRPDGRPSIKIATTQQGSGIDIGGGIDPAYIVLSADDGNVSISLTNKEGRLQVIKP